MHRSGLGRRGRPLFDKAIILTNSLRGIACYEITAEHNKKIIKRALSIVTTENPALHKNNDQCFFSLHTWASALHKNNVYFFGKKSA